MKLAAAHNHWPAAALAALCAVTVLLSIEPQIAQWLLVRLWVLILAIAPGAALTAACVGYGAWLMPKRGVNLPEILVFSLACGIGVMSSLAFVSGMAGQTIGFGPLIIIAGGMILGAARLRTCLAQPAGTTALTYSDTIFSQSQTTPSLRHIPHLAHRTVSLLILFYRRPRGDRLLNAAHHL